MPSQSGHPDYDANLLASAPVATKAQLQSGYNPDLLAEKGTPPSSRNDLEARGRSPVERVDDEHPTPIPSKVPYYRTRKGIITIVVVLVVIIAVAVGGGIAGSKKKTGGKALANDGSSQGGIPTSQTLTPTTPGSPTVSPSRTISGPLGSLSITSIDTNPTSIEGPQASQAPDELLIIG